MKNKWKKPAASTLNENQKAYIGPVPEGNVPKMLEANEKKLFKMVKDLPRKKLTYSYAKGKWTIPQIIQHMIDCERVYMYRALTISRGDTTPLPGFDQDIFIKGIDTSKVDFKKLLKEYKVVRKSTLHLLKNLTEEMYMRKGKANNHDTSVQKIVYGLVGHELHHMKIIKEKYLK